MPYCALAQPPGWVLPGAAADFDFANSRYWGCSASLARAVASFDRGSTLFGPGNGVAGQAPDNSGIIRSFLTFQPRITMGKGLWAEGRYTNYALWCRDCTNAAWTKTNITASKNQTGADGTANAASSLTASAGNGTCLQAITQASTTFVGSAYVKRITGTGTINMTIDGGTTWTDITSSINSSGYTKVAVANQTLANPSIGFQIVTNADAIAVDFIQCENNTYASTPLLTTSATVFRGTEEPAFNDPANSSVNDGYRLIRSFIANGAPWSMFLSASGNSRVSSVLLTDSTYNIALGTDGNAATFRAATGGNTATTANTGTFGLDNINKVAVRANGSLNGSFICLNGGAVAQATAGTNGITAQSNATTHCGVGNNGSGVQPLDGYFKRIALWKRELSDGEMINFTRSDSPYGN